MARSFVDRLTDRLRPMELLRRLVLGAPAAMLSWLGRQGTRAVAALIVIGIAMPSIGALLKPFVTEAVFVLVVHRLPSRGRDRVQDLPGAPHDRAGRNRLDIPGDPSLV
jgi:hypothetical protein